MFCMCVMSCVWASSPASEREGHSPKWLCHSTMWWTSPCNTVCTCVITAYTYVYMPHPWHRMCVCVCVCVCAHAHTSMHMDTHMCTHTVNTTSGIPQPRYPHTIHTHTTHRHTHTQRKLYTLKSSTSLHTATYRTSELHKWENTCPSTSGSKVSNYMYSRPSCIQTHKPVQHMYPPPLTHTGILYIAHLAILTEHTTPPWLSSPT